MLIPIMIGRGGSSKVSWDSLGMLFSIMIDRGGSSEVSWDSLGMLFSIEKNRVTQKLIIAHCVVISYIHVLLVQFRKK